MKLSLVLHGHQPPGNFDHVFQRALDTCYGPVLDLLEERPTVRVSIHWSGSLLEWIAEHAPERIAQIRTLVERDQVELITAGLYEPVLMLLPRPDRIGQLRGHQAYLEELFGRSSDVAWLTERVWEPELAADLVEGGIRTVTLDDQHLMAGGADPNRLDTPFLTESQGRVLRVAPVSGPLRMAIPWEPVEDVLTLIQTHADRGDRMLVYADDIEKFGLWPGTFEDVIESGWLASFFDGVSALDGVEFTPLGEAVEATPTAGRIYIPDGSYPEMLEWSLPPEAHGRFEAARTSIAEGDPDGLKPFLRAGQFRQFLAKYPEVNHLHKRMLDVSARISAAVEAGPAFDPDPVLLAARQSLWRAQANCVYWHGLFGGCYLPHLRHSVWAALLTAERLLASSQAESPPSRRLFDLDADGEDEVVLATREMIVVIDPEEAQVVEVSHLPTAVNLTDTLARRPEAYHDDATPRSYDSARRGWFVDEFLVDSATSPRADATSALDGPSTGTVGLADAEVRLSRKTDLPGVSVRVDKVIRLVSPSTVEADYEVSAVGPGASAPDASQEAARFAVTVNLGLLYRFEPSGTLTIATAPHPLPSGGGASGVQHVRVAMDDVPVAVVIEVSPPAEIDVRPIATESRSEGGFEHTNQALAVLMSWPIETDGAGTPLSPRVQVTVEDVS